MSNSRDGSYRGGTLMCRSEHICPLAKLRADFFLFVLQALSFLPMHPKFH